MEGSMSYRALTETPNALAPRLNVASIAIDDAAGGNGNKKLDPGETVKIIVGIQNSWGDASNIVATLSTSHWTTNVTQAVSNFGTIPGLSNIDGSVVTNQASPFTIVISPDAIPSIVPFTLTLTGGGSYVKTFTFSLTISGSVLVVDDDDGANNVEGYTTSALDALGIAYDVWDHAKKGSPSADVAEFLQPRYMVDGMDRPDARFDRSPGAYPVFERRWKSLSFRRRKRMGPERTRRA